MSNVVVVAPHPDDEVLGCGGTIARHAAADDVVFVIVVSKGAPDLFKPELVEETRREMAQAARVLGTTRTFFLDFPAPRLDNVSTSTVAGRIKEVLTEVRADTIYLPHRGDIHNDHKAVYWATLVAARPNGAWHPRRLLCYETLSETEWGAPAASDAFVPTVFVDISRFLEIKLRAMGCYQSQLAPSPMARSLLSLKAQAQVRGCSIGVAAAEAFSLVREVVCD